MPKRYDLGEVITAMVTPFDKKGDVDYSAVTALAKHLVETGSDAILVSGTTGESPNLSQDEILEVLSAVKTAVENRAKVMLGAGGNSTKKAIEMTKLAEKAGADAVLSVVPYYNKPCPKGLLAHFSEIAESTDLPIMLYNIPSRTGINMLPETVAELANKYQNIFAVKQSAPDMDSVSELKMLCPEDFLVYSGDDSLTLPMLSLGAYGVVSVSSHVFGNEIKSMIHNFKSGQNHAAANMHKKLFPVFKTMFIAPNPTPVKAALARMGIISDSVRLPLVSISDEDRQELFECIDSFSKD